ncbi:MAG: porin family protein [Tabrizicola sp.]|nr:porin family protein [Tabrizicola sp.]
MTIVARSIAVLLLASGAAQAGGPTTVPDDPAPTPAAAAPSAYDWSGPYVGLAFGTTGGDQTFNTSPLTFPFDDGASPSIFAGYLIQRGNLVYGAELAYSDGDDVTLATFSEGLRYMVDLKGRLGFANDRALFYGTLGYSSVGYVSLPGNTETDGFAYGLGVDYAVSDRFTLGLEYLARSTEGDTFNAGETRRLELDTLSLRIGLSF